MAFFELRTARDMLEKAERELVRLRADLSIDNIFNFFVTAYHVQDYVRNGSAVSDDVLNAFLQDQDLKDCQALCHKGKHLVLSADPKAWTDIADGSFGGAAFGEVAFGEGDARTLFYDGRAVDVHSLPDRVLDKWRQFLSQNGL